MGNKKVLNAQILTIDNIKFRSKLEAQMYLILKESELEFRHEPEAIVLVEGFRPKGWVEGTRLRYDKVRAMTYTPDFEVYYQGKCVAYLEIKGGYKTDNYPLKRKLLLNKLYQEDSNIVFMEIHNKKEMLWCISKIKSMYGAFGEDESADKVPS